MPQTLKSLLNDSHFVFKVVEFILCLIGTIALATHVSWCFYKGTLELIIVSADGYALILFVFILAYVFDKTHEFTEKTFLLIGCILNIVAGILTIIELRRRTRYTIGCNDNVTTTLAITTTILCLIGTILFCRYPLTFCLYNGTTRLVVVAVIGYFIIISVLILGHVKEESNLFIEKIFMLIGGMLNALSSLFTFLQYQDYRNVSPCCYPSLGLVLVFTTGACGICMVVNALLYCNSFSNKKPMVQ